MAHNQLAMQTYYRARAAEYDQIYLKPERQDDLAAIRAWLPARFAEQSVLEVACGTGYWTQFIAPVTRRVVALDAAPETLAIARVRVTAPHVAFQIGDAYARPRHLGPFDAAFAGFWFSHVPRAKWQAFLVGLTARLSPGARVVLLDNRYVEGSSTPISAQDPEGNTFQTRRLADGSAHEVLKNFPTEEEMHQTVRDIAVRTEFVRWTHYWAFEFVTREA